MSDVNQQLRSACAKQQLSTHDTHSPTCSPQHSEAGVNVLGVLVSASHDDYVSGKVGRSSLVTAKHRLHLLELAAAEDGISDWVHVDRWEAAMPFFVDFPSVCRRTQTVITNAYPDSDIHVAYLWYPPPSSRLPLALSHPAHTRRACSCATQWRRHGVKVSPRGGHSRHVRGGHW